MPRTSGTNGASEKGYNWEQLFHRSIGVRAAKSVFLYLDVPAASAKLQVTRQCPPRTKVRTPTTTKTVLIGTSV